MAVTVDDVRGGLRGSVGADVSLEVRYLNRGLWGRADLGWCGRRAPPRKNSSVAIAPSLRRIGGKSRYHDLVVFSTDPWFMLGADEAARPRDLAPLRPVRPQPARAPPCGRRPRGCWSARRRIRRLQPAPGAGTPDRHRDGAAHGHAAHHGARLPV